MAPSPPRSPTSATLACASAATSVDRSGPSATARAPDTAADGRGAGTAGSAATATAAAAGARAATATSAAVASRPAAATSDPRAARGPTAGERRTHFSVQPGLPQRCFTTTQPLQMTWGWVGVVWVLPPLAGVMCLVLANATIGFQSLKAALENPAKTLKDE